MTYHFAPTPQLFILTDLNLNHQLWIHDYLTKKQTPEAQIICLNTERGENKNLSIDMVRDLISQASQTSQTTHFLLLHLETASLEAQQALLKILEEPPPQAYIYLTTTSLESILPTIQSRCQVIINADFNENISTIFDTIINQFDPLNIVNKTEGEIIQTVENTLKQLVEEQKTNQAASDTETASSLERIATKQLLSHLAQHSLNQLSQAKSITDRKLLVFSIKQFQTAYKYSLANVNSKLLLENCFFQIKKQFKPLK